jgi:hypothetical protein
MKKKLQNFLRSPALSPAGLMVRAIFLLVLFAILHAMGFREYTSIISGTSPTGTPLQLLHVFIAILYAAFYFASVMLSPVLIIASVVLFGLEWVDRGSKKS